MTGAGAYAGCAYCTHIGEYSKTLQKIIYPGNRRFLPENNPLRNDTSSFPLKELEKRNPPNLKTMEYINQANQEYNIAQRDEVIEILRKTGCKGSYSLARLPLHDCISGTPIDPMHLVKDITEHCIRLITGYEDSVQVRNEEKHRKRFHSSGVEDERSSKLPSAPFSLSKVDKLLAEERACSILVPSSFDWKPQPMFVKITGLKAHEWYELVKHGILKFCLRGMLGPKQRQTLFKLFDVIRDVCAEDIPLDSIEKLEENVHLTLALFERDFPVSLQLIVFHLLHHLPTYMKLYGSVYNFWMFPFERFNSWISKRTLNRRYPESTVIETYRLCEWVHFVEVSKEFHEEGCDRSIVLKLICLKMKLRK